MDITQEILSDITTYMKYSKYLPEKQRRETWYELVTRNKEMHQIKFPHLKDEIEEAYKLVYAKKVLPSMRSLQFAGKPI
jgi:ribonucleoside-diphosphate reductase alpha chain